MISRTNNEQETRDKGQAGVTLLLAILVLSSILAISFSLASILFIEVRTSGDLLRTEPAYYAASGVGEEAIFNVARKACYGQNCSYTSQFNNSVTVPQPQQSSTTTPLFQDTITPSNNSFSSAKTYVFYNPANPNSGSSGYGKISLTYLISGVEDDPLEVYLCQFDASGQTTYNTTPCTDPNDASKGPNATYWLSANPMDPGANNFQTWTLDPTKEQELVLYNGNSQSTANIVVSIETYGSDGITPLGLPYAGQTAVQIDATNADVDRKIRVVVPNNSGSYSGGSQGSSIARVQYNHYYNQSSPSNGILSFNSNTQAGDFIVGIATWYSGSTRPSCTDTQGNSYTNMPLWSTASTVTFVCYASNIAGGADTVTMSGLSGESDPGMNIIEYSGIASSNPLDFSSFIDGSSGSPTNVPASSSFTSNNTDLILPIFADESVLQSSITAGNNYNLIQFDGAHIDAEEDWLNAPPQTNTASFNLSNSSNVWSITVLGFKSK